MLVDLIRIRRLCPRVGKTEGILFPFPFPFPGGFLVCSLGGEGGSGGLLFALLGGWVGRYVVVVVE